MLKKNKSSPLIIGSWQKLKICLPALKRMENPKVTFKFQNTVMANAIIFEIKSSKREKLIRLKLGLANGTKIEYLSLTPYSFKSTIKKQERDYAL